MTSASQLVRDVTQDLSVSGTVDPEVARLAATIDFHSPLSIQEFGSEVAERSARYTDEILASARTGDLDDTGAQLNQIVVAAQQFDLESLDNSLARTPLIGGLIKRFVMTKEKALARFETVKTQVDKLVAQVESTAGLLNRRNRDYQTMYEGVREEYALLGRHVEAITLRLADLDAEIAGLSASDNNDIDGSERVAVLEANRNQLAKRSDDMRVLQHAAMQMLPMVRIIQSNNLSLVDKFQTIRQLTLPAWKRAFMLALTLDEQKSAVELASTIDNATNMMMRRNAELLHQNSVATAKANQRLVIDIDTLREVHQKILLTLADVRKEHIQGAVERKQAIAELERLRTEMTEGVKAIGLADA
ncbi:toxic anion resistance protein [Mesorhizobium sp. NZP2077]|uniref:toxic anion resistance protein n=1 Tax=Mesorhizobium sp. NZP2077 TaxID=2483404 RepID=UPI001552E26D|nr:toxic anion resistance protein [Mesorhizobium sp. NZP2077]QKC82808.1 toxic anion resistance protein [Mesorhizobium sp. NZP2077]QKD16305.1 toxic anion resistance protein [Mesorhizobium sp. NZP2077]